MFYKVMSNFNQKKKITVIFEILDSIFKKHWNFLSGIFESLWLIIIYDIYKLFILKTFLSSTN